MHQAQRSLPAKWLYVAESLAFACLNGKCLAPSELASGPSFECAENEHLGVRGHFEALFCAKPTKIRDISCDTRRGLPKPLIFVGMVRA